MGTTACGGKGSKGRAANGDRPVGAARCRREQQIQGDMPAPPPPKGRMHQALAGDGRVFPAEGEAVVSPPP